MLAVQARIIYIERQGQQVHAPIGEARCTRGTREGRMEDLVRERREWFVTLFNLILHEQKLGLRNIHNQRL